MSQSNFEKRTQWVYDNRAFPVWNASFAKEDRTHMIEDDLWAGRSIAVLLAALVAQPQFVLFAHGRSERIETRTDFGKR